MRLHPLFAVGFMAASFTCLPARAETAPTWALNGGLDPVAYPAASFLTGYGISSPRGSEAEQIREATAMAQAALASSLRSHVSAELSTRVTRQDQQISRFAQNLVSTRTDIELDGLDAILLWPDRQAKVVHALAVLDRARTLALLGTSLERQGRACAAGSDQARAHGDAQGLLQARHLGEEMEEKRVLLSILGGAPGAGPGPALAAIDLELRRLYASSQSLDGFAAAAALELSASLPRGIRILVDRVTYADTPFCGSFSAYLEQALAAQLVACGRIKIVDKGGGRDAIRAAGLDAPLPEALRAQAVVHGACFELGEEVQLSLRVTALGGEELAAATLRIPAALLRKGGLKLVPDNFEEARKNLEICNAQVQASRLKLKLALDRGEGGIYRRQDKLFVFLKANMDCYVKVLYHQVDGTTVVILPNRYHPDARILKDRLYQIPPDDNSFELEVMAPFGVEMVQVLASTTPLEPQDPAPAPQGLQVVKEDLATLVGRTRGISLKLAETQYAEATAVVNTLDALPKQPPPEERD